MCGINGIFSSGGLNDPAPLIQKMNQAIAHRGPDAEGVFAEGNVALGHRRLAIIDLNPEGNQPFYSSDGQLVIVFNGEIYNFREMKKDLTEYPFRTASDTEVILAAWQKWGAACVERLDGMFAFALYDKSSKELFIARDRMGVKPLYYFRDGNEFYFSSEIRALLASGRIKAELDADALVDYLRYQTVHAPRTMLKDVFMLMPGHTLLLRAGQSDVLHEYWNAARNVSDKSKNKSYEEVKHDVRELMNASVAKRLIADVPFGAFLSGGIDSSVVVALMSANSAKPVSTFNISFAEEAFSEAKYARMIAEKFGTHHTEIRISPQEFLRDIPDAVRALDHPSGDGPNTWVVSQVTKKAGITMALSGIGGDELFAGYDVFKRMKGISSKNYLRMFPAFLRKGGGAAMRKFRPGVSSDKMDSFLRLDRFDLQHVYPINRQVLHDSAISSLLDRKSLPKSSLNALFSSIEKEIMCLPELSRISYAEMYSYLQNVLLRDTDQMSMAHALEVREPFLDHALIEYVMGVQDEHKYPHSPKKLLVDSMGDLLPRAIWDRPKMGFTFPWKTWMKNELSDYCAAGIDALCKCDFINEQELRRLWNAFLNDDPRYPWSRVWHLVVLGQWYKNLESRV